MKSAIKKGDGVVVAKKIVLLVVCASMIHVYAENTAFKFGMVNPLPTGNMARLQKAATDAAKKKFFATGDTSDPHFSGVSIQDWIDNRPEEIKKKCDEAIHSLYHSTKSESFEKRGSIDLSNMHISSLDGIAHLPCLDKLKSVDLSHNRIEYLPRVIPNIGKVLMLIFDYNKIKELPESLELPNNIKLISLVNNQIGRLPRHIVGLQHLETLSLTDNLITEIPGKIIGFENLFTLNLGKNQIKEIPATLEGLENLEMLDLSRNQITKLPDQIHGLNKLTHLYLSRNKIKNLPSSMLGLKKLDTLDVSLNAIASFPETIRPSSNEYLRIVDITKNPYREENFVHFDNAMRNAYPHVKIVTDTDSFVRP